VSRAFHSFARYDAKIAPMVLDGRPFATFDPGHSGALMFWTAAGELVTWAQGADIGSQEIDRGVEQIGGSGLLVISESQYVNKNPAITASAIETAFVCGVMLGVLFSLADLSVVEVAPATWQATQHRLERVARARGSALDVMMVRAERVFRGQEYWEQANKKDRTGFASAYGMREWWLGRSFPTSKRRRG
jgi:hypothetical protein